MMVWCAEFRVGKKQTDTFQFQDTYGCHLDHWDTLYGTTENINILWVRSKEGVFFLIFVSHQEEVPNLTSVRGQRKAPGHTEL